MQAKSWVLALALGLASTTVAEIRPRIYVPRHVRRQFTNGSETRDVVFPPATPAPSSPGTGQSSQGQNDNSQAFGDDSSSGQDPLATRSEEDTILAINIPNTVVVQSTSPPLRDGGNTDSSPEAEPTPPPSRGSQPGIADGNDEDNTPTSSAETSSDDSDAPIVIAPTGVVSDEPEDTPSFKSTEDVPSSDAALDQDAGSNAAPTGQAGNSGQDSSIEPPLSEQPSTEEPASAEPTSTVPSQEQTQDLTSTSTSPEPTETKTSEDGGIIDGIIGGITGPGSNTTDTPSTDEPVDNTSPTTPVETVGDATSTEGSEQTSVVPQNPTETEPPTPTEDPEEGSGNEEEQSSAPTPVITPPPVLTDLPLPDPSDVITSIGDGDIPIPLPPVLNDTNTIGTGTGDNTSPTITIPDIEEPTEDPGNTPTGPVGPGGDSTTDVPSEPTSEPTPPPTSEPTGQPTLDPTGEPTGQPTGDPTVDPPVSTPPPTVTEVPTTPTPPPTSVDGGGGGSEEPTTTPPIGNSTTPSGPETTQAPAGDPTVSQPATPVTSIAVLSTVTGTQEWLGTELVADQTASAPAEASAAPAPTESVETLPAGMPKTIEATEEDNPVQPEGTTLIRVVFDRRLHYEFVADNFTAAQQIFTYLPSVISFGENIEAGKIQMMRLAPVETKNSGYFPTAAFLYVPASVIAPLSTDIHLPNSNLYHNTHPVAFQLAAAIDPKYGIMPGSEGDGANDEKGPGGAPFGTGDDKAEEQTPQQKGTTAAIAMGTVSFAVAYGAAMFIVARRYKRKKQAHRRTSSVTNTTSDMRYSPSGSPAMMGGALLSRDLSGYGGVGGVPGGRESHGSGRSGAGNSGRTAYISAPVAAENSLGWN
jgi:hypothetical protein